MEAAKLAAAQEARQMQAKREEALEAEKSQTYNTNRERAFLANRRAAIGLSGARHEVIHTVRELAQQTRETVEVGGYGCGKEGEED